MTAREAIDVTNVISILSRDHKIDSDLLNTADFQFIADAVNNDWNTYDTARELALKVKRRTEGSQEV